MPEKFVERVAEAAGRRGFLKTMSAASAAFALGLFRIQGAKASGGPCSAGTIKVACCCLYKDPTTCTYGDCGCQWAWPCTEPGPDPRQRCGSSTYSCKECYVNPKPPDSDCVGDVKCSEAKLTKTYPPC
jgi:hypothetical protein